MYDPKLKKNTLKLKYQLVRKEIHTKLNIWPIFHIKKLFLNLNWYKN